MRWCADTWFLVKLSQNDVRAQKIFEEAAKGESLLVVPTVCIIEWVRFLFSRGSKEGEVELALKSLAEPEKVVFLPLDEEIAYKAGKISSSHGLHSIDSIIAASSIRMDCHSVLSGDAHFTGLKNLKTTSWK